MILVGTSYDDGRKLSSQKDLNLKMVLFHYDHARYNGMLHVPVYQKNNSEYLRIADLEIVDR